MNNIHAKLESAEEAYLESEEAVLNFEIKYPLIVEGSKDLENLKELLNQYDRINNELEKYKGKDVPVGYSSILMDCDYIIPILQKKVNKFNVGVNSKLLRDYNVLCKKRDKFKDSFYKLRDKYYPKVSLYEFILQCSFFRLKVKSLIPGSDGFFKVNLFLNRCPIDFGNGINWDLDKCVRFEIMVKFVDIDSLVHEYKLFEEFSFFMAGEETKINLRKTITFSNNKDFKIENMLIEHFLGSCPNIKENLSKTKKRKLR